MQDRIDVCQGLFDRFVRTKSARFWYHGEVSVLLVNVDFDKLDFFSPI